MNKNSMSSSLTTIEEKEEQNLNDSIKTPDFPFPDYSNARIDDIEDELEFHGMVFLNNTIEILQKEKDDSTKSALKNVEKIPFYIFFLQTLYKRIASDMCQNNTRHEYLFYKAEGLVKELTGDLNTLKDWTDLLDICTLAQESKHNAPSVNRNSLFAFSPYSIHSSGVFLTGKKMLDEVERYDNSHQM